MSGARSSVNKQCHDLTSPYSTGLVCSLPASVKALMLSLMLSNQNLEGLQSLSDFHWLRLTPASNCLYTVQITTLVSCTKNETRIFALVLRLCSEGRPYHGQTSIYTRSKP